MQIKFKNSKGNAIFIVLPSDIMGGAELFLFNVAKYYSSEKINVFVFFMKSEKSKYWRNLKTVNLIFAENDSERKAVFWLGKTLFQYNKLYQPICIFTSHGHLNGFISVLRFFKLKIRYHVARESTFLLDRFKGLIGVVLRLNYLINYNRINLIIVQTQEMKDSLINNIHTAVNWNLKIVDNPIDLEHVLALGMESLTIKRPYLIAAGRLKKIKRFDILISSFYKEKLYNQFDLIILGEGEELSNLKKLCESYKIEESVFFLGHKANPMPFFKFAEVCVVSSEMEGFPNTLLQMMALNNKVVSTESTLSIKNIPNIITCPINNPEELGKSIRKSLRLKRDFKNTSNLEYLKKRSLENTFLKIESLINEN